MRSFVALSCILLFFPLSFTSFTVRSQFHPVFEIFRFTNSFFFFFPIRLVYNIIFLFKIFLSLLFDPLSTPQLSNLLFALLFFCRYQKWHSLHLHTVTFSYLHTRLLDDSLFLFINPFRNPLHSYTNPPFFFYLLLLLHHLPSSIFLTSTRPQKKIHWWSMISQEKTSVAISFHSFSSPIFIQFPIIYAPTNNNKKSHSPLFWSPILFYFLFFRVYLLLFFLGVIASTAVLVIKTLCKACILIC